MSLFADAERLRDRVLTELLSAHDYFADTKLAWRLVREAVDGGHLTVNHNRVTGTVTTQTELAIKSGSYVAEQLIEATFQQFLSILENFCFDLLSLWLTAHPQSLGKKMVDLKTVMDLPDKDAILQWIIRKEVNELLYERPMEWFGYLEDRAKLGCPSRDEIERISEAKALRDVLVHNRAIANKTYASKAGKLARFRDGERIEISEAYHRETWELIRKVVSDVSSAVITKSS